MGHQVFDSKVQGKTPTPEKRVSPYTAAPKRLTLAGNFQHNHKLSSGTNPKRIPFAIEAMFLNGVFFHEKQRWNVRSLLKIWVSGKHPAPYFQNHQTIARWEKFPDWLIFQENFVSFPYQSSAKISPFQRTAFDGYNSAQPVATVE